MKFRIFIFFVWVSSFSIVSSFHQNQEYGNRYQQHPNLNTYSNYAHNTQVYPAHSQFLNTASNHALHSEPQYGSPHQPETFLKSSESSAHSQVKSSHEYKPLVYIPQPQQELPRPYPVDKSFDLHPEEHVYRPDYTHHVAKPWLSQNNYQPTVNHELYQQPIVYPEPQPSVYQHQPQQAQPKHISLPTQAQPPQQAQPQHPRHSQHAQPHHSPPPQYQPPPHHLTPHQESPHQQTYYKPQPSYAVPVAHAQAEAYATSDTYDAEILASKPEVKDYLESALLKHYQLDNMDDGTSTEDNDDCTSGEIDPINNGDDEVAADSENDSNAVLLSSIDLWEKLLAKQPNLEFQAFNVVTLSPIVEKTSRLFVFPNHTTVEESVETIWKCKGDALPLERKLTTIIKYPRHDENKCD